MIVPSYTWPALFWLGMAGLIAAILTDRRRGLGEFGYWAWVTPCSAAVLAALIHRNDLSSPPVWVVLGMATACVAHGARRAWLARPRPAWYGGAHERIENP